ncbi:MAG: hypothetical protein IJ859_03680, partial [Synergistaceae bacterium]|nr:hypothetical protein [Synergistaceae bacterium]
MKKRLYAILLTSFFLVGIMAAAAAASQVALDTSSFRNRLTITAGSGSAAAGSTTAGSISGVRVGETASAKLTLISAGTLRVDPIEGNSATVVITNVASGAASLDITGVKAGDTKIRIYSGTAESVDVKITVQAATKPVFNVAGNNVDLGHIYDGSNDAFYANQTIRSVDMSFDTKETVLGYRVSLDVARGNGVTSLTATFEPKLDTLNFVTSVDGAAYVDPTAGNNQTEKSYGLKGWLEGTMPNVKADTVYVMTLTATDAAGNSTTSKYKFKVLALPDVSKTKSPKDITWGKADNWTFTPVGTNVDSWDIAISKDNGEKLLSADYIISVDALAEKANIKFDYKTGKMQFGNGSSTEGDELYGWGKSWKPGRQNNYIIVSEDLKTPVTKKVKLIGWKGKGPKAVSASIEIDLNFISEKPALKSGYSLKDFTFNWSEDIKSKDDSGNPKNYIDIEGPGEITVDSADSGLPEGITMFVSEDKSNTSLTRIFFQGKPAETTASKGKKIKFTVKNKADDTGLVLQPTVIVKTDKVSFDVAMNDNANIPSGDVMIKDTITDVTLRAFPGPITWKLENAPKGMTITADKDDSTKAVLSGTYTTARGLKDTRNYKIIATNSDWGKSNTISTDLMVWPELSFKTKSDKAITIKAGSKADFTI